MADLFQKKVIQNCNFPTIVKLFTSNGNFSMAPEE